MFFASNCTCAVYFTYTAHVQLLAKNMAATHVHAICTCICILNQTNTLRFCREDNPLYVFTLWQWLFDSRARALCNENIGGSYGAVSGSKIQVCPFNMMLQHHDTSLRPRTLTLRLTYTTSCLDDITFRQHDLSLRRDDITFRQHRLLLRRGDITFRQHRLLLCRDDITFRLHYRTFR